MFVWAQKEHTYFRDSIHSVKKEGYGYNYPVRFCSEKLFLRRILYSYELVYLMVVQAIVFLLHKKLMQSGRPYLLRGNFAFFANSQRSLRSFGDDFSNAKGAKKTQRTQRNAQLWQDQFV